jgi:subtilase family serine protease
LRGKVFSIREENEDNEENSRMWNATLLRTVLEGVLLLVG